jgi:exonuclease III
VTLDWIALRSPSTCVSCLSTEEKTWLDNFFSEYVDLFRHFHPDVRDVFSVWEAKTDARIHNEGLRFGIAFLPLSIYVVDVMSQEDGRLTLHSMWSQD